MPLYSRSLNLTSSSGGYRRMQFQGYGSSDHDLSLLELLEGTEYDPNLKGRAGVAIYERMSREDSQQASLLGLIKRPLESMTWSVEASTDDVKAFVEDQLGLARAVDEEEIVNKKAIWSKFIHESLLSVELGFSLHEVLQQPTDQGTGPNLLGALAQRPQISIEGFDADDFGLKGVTQILQLSPEKKTRYLKADRLIYTSFSQIGNDYFGRSLLRPNYRNWFFKDALLLMDMIGVKRYNVPVPHAVHRKGMPNQWKQRMRNTLSRWEAGVSEYLITGRQNKDIQDWEIGFLSPDAKQFIDNLPRIKYLDDQSAKAMLVLFIELGTSQSGNRGLGETFTEILYNALASFADKLRDQVNYQLMHHLTIPNFGPDARARLEWSDLSINNMSQYWQQIINAVQAGTIPLTEDLTRLMQNWANIPEEGWVDGQPPKPPITQAQQTEPTDDNTEPPDE